RKARACFARIATVSAGRADPFARRKRNSINCVRHGRYYSLQAQGDFRGIALATCVDNLLVDVETYLPVDRAPSIFIMSRIIVEACDVVAEKSCTLSLDVCDQSFCFGEFELECFCQIALELCLDLLCFCLWSDESQQDIIGIAYVAKASEVGVGHVIRGHALELLPQLLVFFNLSSLLACQHSPLGRCVLFAS